MKKRLMGVVATAALLGGMWQTASAAPYTLYGWFQRSSGGTLSSLMFKAGAAQGCPNFGGPPPTTNIQPCYSPAQPWTSANGVATAVAAAGPATWDWNGTTLTGTGLLWATSFISSNPNGTPVISDHVTNLVITPSTATTTASTYSCVEGAFLVTVGANGCKNTNLGPNFADNSPATWNAGGNPRCVQMTIGGDDYSLTDGSPGVPGTAEPRGLTTQALGEAGAGCAQTSGAFDLDTIIRDDGNILIIADAPNIGNCIIFGAGPGEAAGSNPGAVGPGCPDNVALASISYMIFVAVGAPDSDGDGIPDGLDNCRTVSNAIQYDANSDGYGNICDADLNNSNLTTSTDFNLLRSVLNASQSSSALAAAADMNGSGLVTSTDFNLLRARLNSAPGPSGLH